MCQPFIVIDTGSKKEYMVVAIGQKNKEPVFVATDQEGNFITLNIDKMKFRFMVSVTPPPPDQEVQPPAAGPRLLVPKTVVGKI
jgi:hypothetical protein